MRIGRGLTLLAGAAVLAAVLVAAPAIPTGGAAPPSTEAHAVTVAGWRAASDGWQRSATVELPGLVLVGASAADGDVEVRTRRDGRWGRWVPLVRVGDHGDEDGHGHGDAHGEGAAGPTEPVWTGPSDALELRRHGGTGPAELTAVTVRGGDGLAYAPGGGTRPGAAIAGEQVVSRSEWDPNGDCRPRRRPEYGVARVVFVHHTVIYPRYAPEDADDVVRAICLFHVEQRGFDDLGYNFLVDRYGKVFEGRAGGRDLPVEGAHAAGFNGSSIGVAVLGDFQRDPVPRATVDALTRFVADRFRRYRIDPRARVPVTSTDDGTLSRFRRGTEVTLPTIVGHRDTATSTLCPGGNLYRALGAVRNGVVAILATPDPEATSGVPPGAWGADAPKDVPGDPSIVGAVDVMAEPDTVADLPVTGGSAAIAAGAVLAATAAAQAWWVVSSRRR